MTDSSDSITYDLIVTNPFLPQPLGETFLKENPHLPYLLLVMDPSTDPTTRTKITMEIGNVDEDSRDAFNEILYDLVQPVEIDSEPEEDLL